MLSARHSRLRHMTGRDVVAVKLHFFRIEMTIENTGHKFVARQ